MATSSAPAPLLNGHGRVECSCGVVIAACACGPLREKVKPLVAVRACPGCLPDDVNLRLDSESGIYRSPLYLGPLKEGQQP